MIYQLVDKRTEIFAIVASHTVNLSCFSLLISMPRFNSINFYQNWLKKQNFAKILLNFAKKTQNFRAHGAALLDPRSRHPPLQISSYSPAYTDM